MKVVLSTDAPKPLTIEKIGDRIILELHLNRISLGKESAMWLLMALRKRNEYQQKLVRNEKVWLEVLHSDKYHHILAANSRFVLTHKILAILINQIEILYEIRDEEVKT